MSRMRKGIGLILVVLAMLAAFTTACAAASTENTEEAALFCAVPSMASEQDTALLARAVLMSQDTLHAPAFKLPASLQVIEDEAFEGTSIVTVDLPETLESIGERAFANITTLRRISIPENTRQIARTAFERSDHVTITGAPGSYARTWARENGIPFAPVATVYANAGGAQVSASLSGRRTDVDLNQDAVDETGENHSWRPVGEIKAEQAEQFIDNQILGRAPPACA